MSLGEKIYLTYDQLAEILQISKSTLEKYVSRKEIPYYKFGKNVRFDEEKISDWLRMKEKKPIG
ncbi:helix-turn-helix domain-containing protein [Marispirochaeta aestuarii]|uniref:helix-turn-helix domain-containing protein n=1 Tax=Marispirochaeta aestuarii TaxID=1963862 RepID=UPI002ABD1DE1|nr:helix-turn-helix domain-containing protein [Marispirochaeta aestuarii]